MRKVFLVLVFSLVMIPFSCVMADCSDEEIKAYKEIVKNITVNIKFDEESVDLGIYGNNIVTISGLSEGFFGRTDDMSVGFFYEDMESGEITRSVGSQVKSISFYSNQCSDVKLRTVKLELKQYNYFSDYEECEGLKGKLDVCDPYYDKSLDYDTFMRKVHAYKEEGEIIEKDNVIVEWLRDYYYIPVIVVLVVVGGIVMIIRWKKRNELD